METKRGERRIKIGRGMCTCCVNRRLIHCCTSIRFFYTNIKAEKHKRMTHTYHRFGLLIFSPSMERGMWGSNNEWMRFDLLSISTVSFILRLFYPTTFKQTLIHNFWNTLWHSKWKKNYDANAQNMDISFFLNCKFSSEIYCHGKSIFL